MIRQKYEVLEDLRLTFGTHTRGGLATIKIIEKGKIIELDSEAPNGNVWFNTEHGRGKIECGSVSNIIKRGKVCPCQ